MTVDLVDVAEARSPCKRVGAREVGKTRQQILQNSSVVRRRRTRLFALSAGSALAVFLMSTDPRAVRKEGRMSAVKIGASRQVIIPKKVYDELGLAAGDYLDVR